MINTFVILLEIQNIRKPTRGSNMHKENAILYKSKINSNVEVLVIYPGHPSYQLMKENIFNNKKSVSVPDIKRIIIDGKNLDSRQLHNIEEKEIKNNFRL